MKVRFILMFYVNHNIKALGGKSLKCDFGPWMCVKAQPQVKQVKGPMAYKLFCPNDDKIFLVYLRA